MLDRVRLIARDVFIDSRRLSVDFPRPISNESRGIFLLPIRQTGNSVCRWKTICVGEYSFAFLQTGDARVNKQMLGLYHVSIPTFLFNSFFFFAGNGF